MSRMPMLIAVAFLVGSTAIYAEEIVDSAPSGVEKNEVTVYENGTAIGMPGKDSGTQQGNVIDFTQETDVGDKDMSDFNADDTTIIYSDE